MAVILQYTLFLFCSVAMKKLSDSNIRVMRKVNTEVASIEIVEPRSLPARPDVIVFALVYAAFAATVATQ